MSEVVEAGVSGTSGQTIRKLKVFAFDPGRGRALGNHHVLTIPYEKLERGPVGRLVEVVDEDSNGNRLHEGVDLDAPEILRNNGLEPSESDPRFHQQMVYAVSMHTIDAFERSLGRSIKWPIPERVPGQSARLRLLPHAMKEANAYFGEGSSLHFGYTPATSSGRVPLLPGQMVYSCLIYDVIAHQTVHALLQSLIPVDSIRAHPDGFAFFEGFADLVALLLHFEFDVALQETIQRTGGRLHEPFLSADLAPTVADAANIGAERTIPNPILGLALQFGEATGMDGPLRKALHAPPDPSAMKKETEPHARGQILVSAIFDALFTVYNRRTEDLFRLASPIGPPGALHPDLVVRLAREAKKTAKQMLTMCVRALDWLPPTDIRFGDFLRALISSNYDLIPEDRWGSRQALIDAFRVRGIIPPGAPSYSEEALLLAPPWRDANIFDAVHPQKRYKGRKRINAASVLAFAQRHRSALGLQAHTKIKLRVPDLVASRRIGPMERSRLDYAATVVQTKRFTTVRDGGRWSTNLDAGVQLLIDDEGNVKAAIIRSLASRDLQRRFRAAWRGDDVAPTSPTPPTKRLTELWRVAETRTIRRPERCLSAFAFDPTHGRADTRTIEIYLPYEPLQPGPVGERLAVIDYDASNDRYYPSVDLEQSSHLAASGIPPSERDPRFHQQMVYAVASETIQRFEFALGKRIRWRWDRSDRKDPIARRLRIFPHALQEANAFYDRDLGALVFGYFPASGDSATDIPGQAVFSCLSHDIIAHETTHALLDQVCEFFLETTGPDAEAFHEAFADIIALFQHFSYEPVILDAIRRTRGRIHATGLDPDVTAGPGGAAIQAELVTGNPLVELARQFGEGMGLRASLRSALGTPPGSHRLKDTLECHERGAILVAAVFDGFYTIFHRRTRDLMRLARRQSTSDELHPDLVQRMCREAVKTSRHFVTICVRALDYMPPVDVRFGDFLRAMITADADLVPDDQWDYRGALIDAFRSRGIVPDGATSFTEEGVRWPMYSGKPLVCAGLAAATRSDDPSENARALNAFARKHASLLGLSRTRPIKAHRFHSLSSQRVDPAGRLHEMLVAQVLQQRDERFLDFDPLSAFKFRGGTTLILEDDGTVRYRIARPIDDADRLKRQVDFQRDSLFRRAAAALTKVAASEATRIRLGMLHRGY